MICCHKVGGQGYWLRSGYRSWGQVGGGLGPGRGSRSGKGSRFGGQGRGQGQRSRSGS